MAATAAGASAAASAASVWSISAAVHEAAPGALAAAQSAQGMQGEQQAAIAGSQTPKKIEPIRHAGARVGRNDPCPCGSGKKYKRCHGAGAG